MEQIKRTADEISNEENEAGCDAAEESCKFPGMSYAQGVSDALRWVLGENDDKPYTGN